MTDRPILFSGPMVRAILDGRKTQTRRVLKLPTKTHNGGPIYEHPKMGSWAAGTIGGKGCAPVRACIWHQTTGTTILPPFAPGDRLWIREKWQALSFGDYLPTKSRTCDLRYAATDPLADADKDARGYPWRPSIHMPRWAGRLTLIVTDVRVQRLQDISADDAQSEGVEHDQDRSRGNWIAWRDYLDRGGKCATATGSFRSLWDSLNARRAPWSSNPWVCAVTFEAHRSNIDQMGVTA